MKSAATVLVLSCTVGSLAAVQQPAFDVASVKLHTADQPQMMVVQPGGRFVAVNIPLRMLIRTAFRLQDDQIVGGPEWVNTDRVDVDARAANLAGVPGPQLLSMLQSLIVERFRLRTHRETQEISVFALEHARGDRTLGTELRPTACPDLAVDITLLQPCANIQAGLGSLTLRGAPLDEFSPFLSSQVNRVVVNRTGLDGRYDIDLKWTPERPGQPGDSSNDVSIFTALQEQLGLKLTATRAPVEVLVIDEIERPAPN